MFKSKFSVVRGLVAGLAVLTVGTGTANAAVYRPIWDPLFNPAYNATLGWAGEGTVSLNASCLAGGAGVYSVASLGCGAVTLTSYKLDLISIYPGPVTASTGNVLTAQAISTIRVDAFGDLDAVELTAGEFLIGPFTPSISPTLAFLDFVIDPGYAGPILRLQDPSCIEGGCSFSSATEGVNAPVLKWTLVPEPASLALVGVALAALGLSRRRKT